MAAYAALVSLINNIQPIKNHPRVSTFFDKKQLESLLERVDSLLVFIESYNSYGGSKDDAEELERQIASAAHAAEDVIESHIVDQILPEILMGTPFEDSPKEMIHTFYDRRRFSNSTEYISESPIWDGIFARSNIQLVMQDLWKIIQDMDFIREKVMKFEEVRGCKVELPPQSSMPPAAAAAASSRQLSSHGMSKMVGFDGYVTQLLLKLTGHQPDRQIIPIVGMGGLGKTTLARNAYDSLPVVRHFIVRAWVVISQTYVLRDILYEILSCLGQSKDEMDKKEERELCEQLHKTLFDRRYLIVIDDVWSIEAWDRIKFFFPNNCNGSRILVTTRVSDVAYHFDPIPFELNFLDEVHSWELFCEKVFPQEACPLELEESGKKIVKKCRGLPLAIVVIGGLLTSTSRTRDQWENVEKDIASMLNTANDNQCLNLLSLSYSHLPARLKPCFLYMGIFPEDHVIHVSRLVKLWVAEGFIKPNEDQSLEEIAESYVKDLVDRNLISVHSLRWNGKVKTFRIHDLLRDLGIREAEKEKFLSITSERNTPLEIYRKRRCIFREITCKKYYNKEVFGILASKPFARSLISYLGREVHVNSRLLRVVSGVYWSPRDIVFRQVNLRFFAEEDYWSRQKFPSSISFLWNVQTLIMRKMMNVVDAPPDIWEMPQLRHLKFNRLRLPEPPPGDGVVLHNLQTVGTVVHFRLSEEACKRMPNVKKLDVCFVDHLMDVTNLALFSKLESLHCDLPTTNPEKVNLLQHLKFPNSLKKLTLERFPLQWKDMAVIGSLPNLEVLILEKLTIQEDWDPVEGEFLRLRFLRLVDSNLVCWNADDTHFPVLENLVLEKLEYLHEIPPGIGEIQTLERISLARCSDSCALSALKILEEQHDFGNKQLQVRIRLARKSGVKNFMELVEAEGLAGLNFQVDADQY